MTGHDSTSARGGICCAGRSWTKHATWNMQCGRIYGYVLSLCSLLYPISPHKPPQKSGSCYTKTLKSKGWYLCGQKYFQITFFIFICFIIYKIEYFLFFFRLIFLVAHAHIFCLTKSNLTFNIIFIIQKKKTQESEWWFVSYYKMRPIQLSLPLSLSVSGLIINARDIVSDNTPRLCLYTSPVTVGKFTTVYYI